VSRELRETVADWLMILGALVLVISLFLTWSHQLSPGFRAQFAGTPALVGVPRAPTAWQVYSIADVCLALVATTLIGVAFVGTRSARLFALVPAGIALAFVIHAAGVPPTNGLTAALPAGYLPDHPTSGAGETVALAAIGTALAGLALSFTAD
jgi:hypothetical protein